MNIEYTLANGGGNSFIIIEKKQINNQFFSKENIQKLCSHPKINVDALLLISKKKPLELKLDYYNRDGSWASFCANGTRCVGLYYYKKTNLNNFIIQAGDGPHYISAINNKMKLKMEKPKYIKKNISIDSFIGNWINSGADHFVVETSNFNYDFLLRAGKKLRFHDVFKPNGININFYKKNTDGSIKVTTYEKGVEKIMDSCGSGSTAAAFHVYQHINKPLLINLHNPSSVLQLSIKKNWDNVWLSGPACLSSLNQIII